MINLAKVSIVACILSMFSIGANAQTDPQIRVVVIPLDSSVATDCPTSLDTLSNWFTTNADSSIQGFSSINLSLTFHNNSGDKLEVDGTQRWSLPDVSSGSDDIPILGSNLPVRVPIDEDFTMFMVFDISNLPDSETGLAIRPEEISVGQLGPGLISFVSATINCNP